MKKTEMPPRKSPLPRTSSKGLRRVAKNAYCKPGSRLDRERREWGQQYAYCWLCGNEQLMRIGILDVHEIASRAQAPGRWAHKCNYFAVCRLCHPIVQEMEYVAQLAGKALFDWENFDLPKWIKILGRGPLAVTEQEVLAAVVKLFHERIGRA